MVCRTVGKGTRGVLDPPQGHTQSAPQKSLAEVGSPRTSGTVQKKPLCIPSACWILSALDVIT